MTSTTDLQAAESQAAAERGLGPVWIELGGALTSRELTALAASIERALGETYDEYEAAEVMGTAMMGCEVARLVGRPRPGLAGHESFRNLIQGLEAIPELSWRVVTPTPDRDPRGNVFAIVHACRRDLSWRGMERWPINARTGEFAKSMAWLSTPQSGVEARALIQRVDCMQRIVADMESPELPPLRMSTRARRSLCDSD